MDENLVFQRHGGGDGTDLIQGKLARQYYAARPGVFKIQRLLRVMAEHLSGGVDGDGWEMIPQQGHKPEVLHDDTVNANILEKREKIDDVRKLVVEQEGVERDVDAPAVPVGEERRFFKLLLREVAGALSGVEIAGSEIEGVGARPEGGGEGFGRARRCEEFGFILHGRGPLPLI